MSSVYLLYSLAALSPQARPLPDLGHAFQVHESGLPLTVPQEPHLATGARAVEREEFDHAVEEKAKMLEVGAWGGLLVQSSHTTGS